MSKGTFKSYLNSSVFVNDKKVCIGSIFHVNGGAALFFNNFIFNFHVFI